MCEEVLYSCVFCWLHLRRFPLPSTSVVNFSVLHESIEPCVLFIVGSECAGAQSLPLCCCQEAVSDG